MNGIRAWAAFAGVAALSIGAVMPERAQTFGTLNHLGQNAEHEKITRLALGKSGFQPDTLDQLAGKHGSFGAVGSPDNPARGLLLQKSAHCDGGDYLDIRDYPQSQADAQAALAACRAWMKSNLLQAVANAGALLDESGNIRDSQIPTFVSCTFLGQPGRAKCNVLEALGVAFHTAQDFYAHTNWTDANPGGAPSITDPPGLAQRGPADWLDFSKSGMPFAESLISGCFNGVPESAFCGGRVKHAVLNKDEGAINVSAGVVGAGTTERGKVDDNFAHAVNAAVLDTQNKWDWFSMEMVATYGQERATRMICAIQHDNPVKTCP